MTTDRQEAQTMAEEAKKTPFNQFLAMQRKGLLHEELTDQLAAVLAGVKEHGKAGKLTMTFTIKPEGDEAVKISDQYSAKIPTPPASPSLFFTDGSQISRKRLDQDELPFTAVPGGKSISDEQDRASEGAS